MALPPPRNLTAADGAKFLALIEEMPDGQWRASAVVRLDTKSKIDEQQDDVCMFQSEEAARGWIHKAAAARGFSSVSIEVKRA
jgi:hypothetical protein